MVLKPSGAIFKADAARRTQKCQHTLLHDSVAIEDIPDR